MILGCDVGTGFTKAVLMDNGSIRYYTVVPTDANPDKAMEKVFVNIRENCDLKPSDMEKVFITGWGEEKVSTPHIKVYLVNCIGRAAVWAVPSCRGVLHSGSQQSMVLSVNDKGRVLEFRVNDKCATGSGKFLEVISAALEINVEDISDIVATADKDINISGQCAVFGESEVVSRVNDGESEANIIAAIVHSYGRSIATLAKRINMKKDFVFSGGMAKNKALENYLQDLMKNKVSVFQPEPDLIAAVGAALTEQEVGNK